MKLSIFTTMTDPTLRGDMLAEPISCFTNLADEVVVIDGGNIPLVNHARTVRQIKHPWPREFDWLLIGEQYQRGYEACTGDWALFADLDFIFHEDDFKRIREVMEKFNDRPALSFYKYQFVLPDRYNIKSRRVIAINKRLVGDRIKFNGGGDLCQPTLDGVHLTPDDVPESGIPFYNYEKILKTKEQIMDDVNRMERAYTRHFGKSQYGGDGSEEGTFRQWHLAQMGKFSKPQKTISIYDHPMFVQKTISNLKPDQFGYSGFGIVERRVYA